MKILLHRLLPWSLALLLVLPVLLLALVSSESGSRRVLQLALAAAASDTIDLGVAQIDGTLAGGMRLQGLHYAAADDSAVLQIRQLEFAWQPWLLLQRRLRFDALRVEGLEWRSNSTADESTPFDAGEITAWFAALPLTVELSEASGRELRIAIDDNPFSIPAFGFSAVMNAHRLALSGLTLDAFDTRVRGALTLQQDLRLDGELQWAWGVAGDYAGALQIGGTLRRLELRHTLQQPWALLSTGAVDTGLSPGRPLFFELLHLLDGLDLAPYGAPGLTLADLRLVTRGEPERIELAAVAAAAVPELGAVSLVGEGLYTPQAFSLDSLQLEAEELAVQLEGSWQFDSSRLLLDWRLLRLALEREGVSLQGGSGGGSVELVLTDAGADATLQLGPLAARLNDHELSVDGTVQVRESQIDALSLRAESGGNTLALAGDIQPELALDWTLAAPALGQLHAGLSGALEGGGRVAGSLEEPRLEGRLRGRELQLLVDSLRLGLQSLELDANSRAGADNTLQLRITGLEAGDADAVPLVIDSLTATLSGMPAAHALQLQAEGMASRLELAVDGSWEDAAWEGRLARALLASPYGDWRLQGSLPLTVRDDLLRVDRHCWSGTPIQLCLALAGGSAAGYELELDVAELPLSWLNRADQAPGKPVALQELQAAHGVELPPGMSVQGVAMLQARIGGLGPEGPSAVQAELRTAGLEIVLEPQEEVADGEVRSEPQRFSIAAEPLRVTLQQDTWRARLDIAITQAPDAELAAVFQGSLGGDLTVDREQRLGGVVQLAFADLAFIETLVPGLQRPAGRLQGQARLAGTLAEPELEADVSVSDAAFTVPALGIDLEEVTATLRSSGDEVTLRAGAASGAGSLLLDARVSRPLAADRELSASLQGSDFHLLETPAISATVSPSVELRFVDGMLSLEGSVAVPQAALDLESVVASVADGGVKLSRDVVVIEPDATALVAEQQRALPFDARLALLLGDAVQVRGFGLDARLNGELRLEQEADRPLLAYGELGIPQGSYRIYNQELNARDGRLIFYGNPVNPMLDVRAFRETSTAEVGMLLSGTFERMQSRLYSTPTLPENEILALLVTGKSFNNMNDQDGNALLSAVANFGIERGEGLTSMIGDKLGFDSVAINSGASYLDSSLGLGKYITPDLLMRYEIGLFDRQAVLSIDYSLTTRLKLELRSGLNQSVDISYTIEKD